MRSRRLWARLILGGVLIAGMAALVLWRLGDHDLSGRNSEVFDFTANGAALSGTVWLPDQAARAAVVFVHGDGAQDRVSGGGYAPLINALLDDGIAVASWDKPGVGKSDGDWLALSMDDRARETRAALKELAARFEGIAVGAVGFSQAGWVLPRLEPSDTDFIALVGPAVSWRDQGQYYTRTRLRLEGARAAEIAAEIEKSQAEDDVIFAESANYDPALAAEGLSEARWNFIRRNRNEDSRPFLQRLDMPVLAIWGSADLNVDAAGDSAIYEALLAGRNQANRIIVVPDATHGLLAAGPYNTQLASEWSAWTMARFLLEGRHAFAPGFIEELSGWIHARANEKGQE